MELENDPRFDSVETRGRNAEALVALFDEKFAQKTREEWLGILAENSCIATPIQAPMEVVQDPQVVANDYVLQRENPEVGTARTTGFPWSFSATPASYRRRAPGLGEHTDEVLTEAGYSAEQIAKLREDKIVG
jgi:crotonobetainyl-CoA:carnitine CoA-transferase CaiB-like acyl-CoA transferase